MNISIVVPLLNESESLPELEAWIRRVAEENKLTYEILFVDDGSTDGSWHVIQELQKTNPCVKALRFRRNYGKSAALNEGFKVVRGDVVFTMDADLQDSPDEIPEMYRMVIEEGYDIVSGWKKVRHDSKIMKNIPSKIYNWTTRKMTGIKLHDMNCGLKAYRGDVVRNIEIYGEMHRYIPVIAKAAGFSHIGEKVVHHQKRKYGTSKFGLNRFVRGYLDLMSITFVSKFGKRPMHLFGGGGTLMFLIGFAIAVYLVCTKYFAHNYVPLTDRPLFYLALLAMVIGTQMFLTGFLAELVSVNSGNKKTYSIAERLNLDN